MDRADFRVHLVAHSMGGLVVRCFLQNETAGDKEARACVDKVFTATPHNVVNNLADKIARFAPLRWALGFSSRGAAVDGPRGVVHENIEASAFP